MKRITLVLLAILLILPFTTAAHWITGYVNDALDGEPANNKIVTIWNPAEGQSDNVTDIIGPSGNSGTNNVYFIDCEALSLPCTVGDTIIAKIFNSGDDKVTEQVSLTVTGAAYDLMENLTINSPPTSTLVSPGPSSNNPEEVEFNCSFSDLDENLANVTLWFSQGGWHANETKTISPGETSKTFTKTLVQGFYSYNCFVQDNLSIGTFATNNNTFFVDTTEPIILDMQLNSTETCGNEFVKVNCTAVDFETAIHTVLIEATSPSLTKTNYTATPIGGDVYETEIQVTEYGTWNYTCYANDSVGNDNYSASKAITAYSEQADLELFFERIFVNKLPSFENELITITADIENKGCGDANSFIVGLFEGNKDLGGTSYDNITTTITGRTSQNVSINWSARVGTTNLFIYTDLENIISEENESNNNANKSLTLTAWQEIYGEATIDKLLANSGLSNFTFWDNETDLEGNIFVTDSELDVDWLNLQAIGKTKTDISSSSDFTEIDSNLGMSSFNDSVYKIFTNSGTPKSTENLTIFGTLIDEIPAINSTDNTNFFTGILWDTSDSLDDEYDSTEKEDLIFVTQVNKQQPGKYGTYDYEIRIPVKLREYDQTDTTEVYYYYELN